MAKIKPLHHGPMMPLAIMAVFALMVPILVVSNNTNEIKRSNAMRMRVPTNEPTYQLTNEDPTATPMMTPKATNRGMMKY